MKTEYVYKNEKDCKSEYKNIIESLTLEEKVGLLSGRDVWSTKPIKRLGIPEIYLSDGPNGVRKQIGDADHLGINKSLPATCFPSLSTMANSWDEVLLEQLGEKIGEEAKAFNVNVLLGPGINIKRSPLCGRNFEYFSEDPYLSGKMAAAYIRGVQNKGVSACPKHFAVNSQENKRMTIDSIVDERTLREIYLTGFEIAVKEGKPWTIMTSYNKVNGVYANENSHLLKDILRNEWEYEGVVVTDWGGSNDHVAGVEAGSSLEMPGTAGDSDRQLRKAVKNKRISEDIINDRAEEVLRLIYNTKTTGRLVAPGKDIVQRKIEQEVKISKRNEYHLSKKNLHMEEFDVQEHHEFARKALEQSIVLLKNENNILPLKKKTKTVIIGEFAEKPRIQGAGSS